MKMKPDPIKFIVLAFLASIFEMPGYAGELRKPIGQKEGIKLHAKFVVPFDAQNPKIICELENTTVTPVAYQLRGAEEGPAFEIHLYDLDGDEVPKSEIWTKGYESGDSMHVRFGVLPVGMKVVTQEIKLFEVYGDQLKQGVRLEILWNVNEHRTGPGPFGGVFGIGSGVNGSVIVPWAETGQETDPASSAVENVMQHQTSENLAEPSGNLARSNGEKEVSTHRSFGSSFWIFSVAAGFAIAILLVSFIYLKRRASLQ